EKGPVLPKFKPSENDCVGPLVKTGKPRTIELQGKRFRVDGYLLEQIDKDPDKQITLGILSDSKENTPENRQNLRRILEFFKQKKVEAIIHLGDVASVMTLPEESDIEVAETGPDGKPLSKDEINRARRRKLARARREAMSKGVEDIVEMLSVLAESDLPLFVIIGNRECKSTFNMALATLAEDFPNVFNLNFIRRVDLDDIDIISQPGYHDPEYVHCRWDKCIYFESDTLFLDKLVAEANDPVLLVSHGPPRQKDRNGIDVVSEGANVGCPWLTEAIRRNKIPFGAFGNIQEAGGKATNLDGDTIIPKGKFVDSLYINPGPADSMAWSMNDGTESHGMAAVLEIVDNKARYEIFRVGQEAEPKPAPAKTEQDEKESSGQ
ncbi:MAG: hypothetical protein D6806_03450, partial [Deltaproteobacteria bacterium]